MPTVSWFLVLQQGYIYCIGELFVLTSACAQLSIYWPMGRTIDQSLLIMTESAQRGRIILRSGYREYEYLLIMFVFCFLIKKSNPTSYYVATLPNYFQLLFLWFKVFISFNCFTSICFLFNFILEVICHSYRSRSPSEELSRPACARY